MDLGLRNALIAKTALRDSKIANQGLIITAIQEATSQLDNDSNPGHKNIKVIKDKSRKIYKNLLKQYSSEKLYKDFTTFYTSLKYRRKYKQTLNKNSPKKNIINTILEMDSPLINRIIEGKNYENSHS